MKQTATEWLFQKLWDEPKDKLTWYAILKQAKEMEKQIVIDIVEKSRATGLTAEYLLLTYGSKGSDDINTLTSNPIDYQNHSNMSDNFKQFSLYEHKETIATADTPTSSQTEISDEEWKKIVKEINKQPMIFVPNEISDEEIKNIVDEIYPNANGSSKLLVSGFIQGCRWYREQLKKK